MPSSKSAEKRVRTSEKAHRRNVKKKTEIKSLRKGFVSALATPEDPTTPEAYRAFCSALDKAAKQGIVPKNTAIRKKARAAAALRKATAP